MKYDAYTDTLTNIGNRRKFNDAFNIELLRVKRNLISSFSLILIDIDHFKVINDHYGHGQGDEVLKVLAQLIQVLLRATDTVCRWGGEEFAVLLPGTPVEGAQLLAERIRARVSEA
jgi:diguanylate cyclase (GGDEF)-like protein